MSSSYQPDVAAGPTKVVNPQVATSGLSRPQCLYDAPASTLRQENDSGTNASVGRSELVKPLCRRRARRSFRSIWRAEDIPNFLLACGEMAFGKAQLATLGSERSLTKLVSDRPISVC